MRILKGSFSTAGFFYLLVLLFVFLAVDYKKVISHSRPKTLSRLRVPYAYLVDSISNNKQSRDKYIDGIRYFNAIDSIYGDRPDTNIFLGVSFFYIGKIDSSKAYFLKLVDSVPGFFWGYYNLALLAYKERNYLLAIDYCQKAFESPMDKTVAFMMSSKVYQPLFIENGFTPQLLVQNIDRARVYLLKVLVASKSSSPLLEEEGLPIKAF